MNLSDLRLVVGLKSNSNIYPNIFRSTNINNSPLPGTYQGYTNFSGKADNALGTFTFQNHVAETYESIFLLIYWYIYIW